MFLYPFLTFLFATQTSTRKRAIFVLYVFLCY
nr:MAG TPA: hypothetical protein [Caudoviricetes sp.]